MVIQPPCASRVSCVVLSALVALLPACVGDDEGEPAGDLTPGANGGVLGGGGVPHSDDGAGRGQLGGGGDDGDRTSGERSYDTPNITSPPVDAGPEPEPDPDPADAGPLADPVDIGPGSGVKDVGPVEDVGPLEDVAPDDPHPGPDDVVPPPACEPYAFMGCNAGAAFWFDSCETPQEAIEICAWHEPCSDGACQAVDLTGEWLVTSDDEPQEVMFGTATWSDGQLDVHEAGLQADATLSPPGFAMAGALKGGELVLVGDYYESEATFEVSLELVWQPSTGELLGTWVDDITYLGAGGPWDLGTVSWNVRAYRP